MDRRSCGRTTDFPQPTSTASSGPWHVISLPCATNGRQFMVDREALERANARTARRRATGPHAVSARYDRRLDRVIISLSSGLDVAFAPHDVQGLERAKPADLTAIEISPAGLGL